MEFFVCPPDDFQDVGQVDVAGEGFEVGGVAGKSEVHQHRGGHHGIIPVNQLDSLADPYRRRLRFHLLILAPGGGRRP